jgi:putative transposase
MEHYTTGRKEPVVEITLEYTELSPRELSCRISDAKGIFISESSVYRILKARGLITSPSHILLEATNEYSHKTCFVHEMWQTDLLTLKYWDVVLPEYHS